MIPYKRIYTVFIVTIFGLLLSSTSHAVIVLDSTFKKNGFKPAEAIALLPQFASLIFLQGDSGSGSGSWIGNYQGHGYVLTAGHLFTSGMKAADYTYQTLDGTEYEGDTLFIHPLWNGNNDDRTGYDFAIVRLTHIVTTAGAQPALYAGQEEHGKKLTFVGYGWRGTGLKGQDTSIDTHNLPAGGEGLIEYVEHAVVPVPKTGDAGNYFGIWLPKEDGSIPNPLDKNGITKPFSQASGILGSGDSGGPAWILTPNDWAIAGINSNGSGNAKYGDVSWFPRISQIQDWVIQIQPDARFIK